MKKYLLIALAAFGFAACSQSDDETIIKQEGGEKSYVAVTVKSTDDLTRATEDANNYEDGTADENKVTRAMFFFFNENGEAFNVGNGVNYVILTNLTDNGKEAPNVESIKNKVLVLNAYEGAFPAKMAAVMNWNYTGASLSLDALSKQIVAASQLSSGDGFVLSNSVYATETATPVKVDCVALTAENIATTEANALAKPVTVYVERVAAKVTVTNNAADDTFDTGTAVDTIPVKVKVLGWDLIATEPESYLFKQFAGDWATAWTDELLGFDWNYAPYFRSFWAASKIGTVSEEFNYNSLANLNDASEYCCEQTGATTRTKIVIKAQLVDEDGDAYDVANWYGAYYASEAYLLNAVAATLKNSLVDKSTSTPIAPEQLKCVPIDGSSSVKFALAEGVADNIWYSYDTATGEYSDQPVVVADVLGALANALVWKDGMTYYTTDIRHLAAKESGKPGEFGIVRNHSYKVNITGIQGLGTPVYNPTGIVTPEEPETTKSYVSSEVRVLSWRLVSQDVTLQ